MTILAQNEQKPNTQAIELPLRLEAWAEMERHFAESDRLIAAWLAPGGSRRLNIAYVASLRERRFSWWSRLEHRAKTEIRLPSERDRAAREYLTGYVRPSERHASLMTDSLMERACPTWLIWSTMGFAALWFFVPVLFPDLIDFLKGLFQ